MLIIGFKNIGTKEFSTKYPNKVTLLDPNQYKKENWPITYIEKIKQECSIKDIVIIPYINEIILCLDALNIEYIACYPDIKYKEDYKESINEFEFFEKLKCDKLILEKNEDIESALKDEFDWIEKEELPIEVKSEIPENKNKLTMEQLLDEDLEITEANVRELKATQNKLKVGMLLQAKNSLNRILKLSNTLDKLYDELLDRIDNDIKNTDTASLMYTTEYISKALNDTNQFITNLISNDKIQNFFVIDNSIININHNDDPKDIDKRERIRKAVEIVLNNLDSFENGDFRNLKDPNVIEVTSEEKSSE